MVARRGGSARGLYTPAELAGLLGCTERTARAAIRRLVAAGLIDWKPDAINDPPTTGETSALDTISRGAGPLAIPRRLLRWLCRSGSRPLIATALAALLRCVSRRKAGWTSRGRFKASWVAGVFGIAERHAKAARAELVRLGWLAPVAEACQWAWNRWGRAFRVALDWAGPAAECHPSPAGPGAGSSPPDQTPTPSGGNSNPEPARGGGTGACASGGTPDTRPRGPVTSPPAISGPPTLRDIKPADLADPSRSAELHRQAVARGWVPEGEHGEHRFRSAVAHARRVGREPCRLLAAILRRGLWSVLTIADEDAARRRSAPPRPVAPAPRPEAPPPIRSPYARPIPPPREPSPLGSILARVFPGAG